MLELRGKYSTAIVYTDNVESSAQSQIIELCNQDFAKDSKIRIMPDTHAWAGCVIGFTANLGDKVIPNLIGVDIGCGMLAVELGKCQIASLEKLDDVLHNYVPAGANTHDRKIVNFDELKHLFCYTSLKDMTRIECSIGTLGGGNHFQELNVDDEGNHYLVIHSGSRNLGKQVAEHYQRLAVKICTVGEDIAKKKQELIADYKNRGIKNQLQKALKELDAQTAKLHPKYPAGLCFLTDEFRKMYLHDMQICQHYAELNRSTMAEIILQNWLDKKLKDFSSFQTVHNYINFKDNIIRKGAISAYKDEKVIIPINMRDGSLVCIGKGNPEWNYSAPHGAGRLMSRSQAKDTITLDEYRESMKGIYSTCISTSTKDESPMAYKPMQEIIDNIQDTVDIVNIIKPIYNFKAGE